MPRDAIRALVVAYHAVIVAHRDARLLAGQLEGEGMQQFQDGTEQLPIGGLMEAKGLRGGGRYFSSDLVHTTKFTAPPNRRKEAHKSSTAGPTPRVRAGRLS
jgi:hypothetical protein